MRQLRQQRRNVAHAHALGRRQGLAKFRVDAASIETPHGFHPTCNGMILGVGMKLALVGGNGLHLFLRKTRAIHNEIGLWNMLEVRAEIVVETARVVRLAGNGALGQLGVKARVN